jgi:hypothetical protein
VFVGPAKADAFGKYVIAHRPPPVGSDWVTLAVVLEATTVRSMN